MAAATLAAACAGGQRPDPWDVGGHRDYLGVTAADPWCGYMADLRAHLDGGPKPSDAARMAALDGVRDEIAAHGDDPYWPFRKALICEMLDGAAEERAENDFDTARIFLSDARIAATNPFPNGQTTLAPVYDRYAGFDAPSLSPVDVSDAGYCDDKGASDLALTQQRGVAIEEVSFPGSLRRAPDWFAHVQVAYNRWAREQVEGHMGRIGADDHGGITDHCRRFHAALVGSREFAVKENLIFLLPEIDDPNKSGRLEVTDAEGNTVVLDRILAAAQLNRDGTGGEPVDFFAEDLAASPSLSGAVKRSNDLPPPEKFTILFGKDEDQPLPGDKGVEGLRASLEARDPDEPIRIAMTGHTDCVGSRFYNQRLSQKRVDNVFLEVIAPVLVARGFAEKDLKANDRLKLEGVGAYAKVGLGESAPRSGVTVGACAEDGQERRVSVVVQ